MVDFVMIIVLVVVAFIISSSNDVCYMIPASVVGEIFCYDIASSYISSKFSMGIRLIACSKIPNEGIGYRPRP